MKNRYTLYGILAILFWSSTIGFSRSLTEQLGPLTAGMIIHTVAGLLGLSVIAIRTRDLSTLLKLPRRYLFICGTLMVVYITLLYISLGLAQNHTQVLIVGLINYLWPALTLLFSLPILGYLADFRLPLGILLALAGTTLALLAGEYLTWSELRSTWLPYGLVFLAAVSWSLYTNLAKRFLGESDRNGVALFLLAGGLTLGALRLTSPETSTWSLATIAQLAYVIVCPGFLAYTLWDLGTRKGQITLLAVLSYFTPLLSTMISALVLKTPVGPGLWLAAGMILLGAVISQAGIHKRTEAEENRA
jgi:drug/metabolite transporter (DMT)-like permease